MAAVACRKSPTPCCARDACPAEACDGRCWMAGRRPVESGCRRRPITQRIVGPNPFAMGFYEILLHTFRQMRLGMHVLCCHVLHGVLICGTFSSDARTSLLVGAAWLANALCESANPRYVGVWSEWSEVSDFDVWRLSGNVVIACLLSCAATTTLIYVLRYGTRIRQFSIRTLLCLTACAAGLSAAYGYFSRLQRFEQEAVVELETIGWQVYSEEGKAVPEWVFRLSTDLHMPGVSVFMHVGGMEWQHQNATISGPRSDVNIMLRNVGDLISRFRYCDWVKVKDPALSDDGVAALCDHPPNCRWLELDGSSRVTDAALKHILPHWPEIRSISLSGSSVSDAGLHSLATLSHLE